VKYFSSAFHFLFSLHIRLVVLLLGTLLELSLFIHSRTIYQGTLESMHFQFVILKIKKTNRHFELLGIFCLLNPYH
jgi:hypothetical protein